VRPFAERIRALAKPGDRIGIYQRSHFHDFNFYSGIKRFEILASPKDVVKFSRAPGRKFILVLKRRLGQIKKAWQEELKLLWSSQEMGWGGGFRRAARDCCCTRAKKRALPSLAR
jgi:hypothetical protein